VWEPAEWINGKLISPEVSDTIAIPPGEPYECTIDEAVGLLRVKEGQVVSEPAPQACLDAIAAYDREQAAKYPACTLRRDDAGARANISGTPRDGAPW